MFSSSFSCHGDSKKDRKLKPERNIIKLSFLLAIIANPAKYGDYRDMPVL
jgi:hypothetical protein